jgi:hypothetical protein
VTVTPIPHVVRALSRREAARDPVLARWLMYQAAQLEALQAGAVEISRQGSDVWGFVFRDSDKTYKTLVRGVVGSPILVDALCAPFDSIVLPLNYEAARGRVARAVAAFEVGPEPVQRALRYIVLRKVDGAPRLQFFPPDDWRVSFVRTMNLPGFQGRTIRQTTRRGRPRVR